MRDPDIVSPKLYAAIIDYVTPALTPDQALARAVDAQWNVEVPAAGLLQHGGENRHMRRAASAQWKGDVNEDGETTFTRRMAVKQYQRRQLGKLDPKLRRLQELDIASKKGKR